MSLQPVMIVAGGTGGHIFPALAVAHELIARDVPVVWMGTRAGLEARLVPEAGIEIEWLQVTGLRGRGLIGWLLAPLRLVRSLLQAIAVLRKRRPAVVLGLGGFVSGPGGLAAWLLDLPLVIHEQNSVAGLTNRLLRPVADRALQGFDGALGDLAVTVGNPVRGEIAALAPPQVRLADREGPVRLLVLGGSQGALALNRAIPRALAGLSSDLHVQVRHQTGERTRDEAELAYEDACLGASIDVKIETFIADMAGAYAWSDLVVCRAGALTVAELAAAGAASILVPFPAAVDDHQTGNATYLVGRGAAVMMAEREMSADRLAEVMEQLFRDPEQRMRMALAARAAATPGSAARVAEVCRALHPEVAA